MWKASNMLVLLVCLALMPVMLEAKTISEIFGKGVLETEWGMSISEVKLAHPGGDLQEVLGTTRYFVKDGRSLFGIEREKKSFIGFLFGADHKLNSISIGMPSETEDFGRVLNSITSALGVEPQDGTSSSGVPATIWKDKSDVELELIQSSGLFSRSVTLILKKKLSPQNTTKEDLGF